jgi:uncharacterized protein DUF4249
MKKTAYFILLGIALAACTEKIDVKLDETYTRLVVEGSITDDTCKHQIKLSTTSSYFYNQPAPIVSDAQVSISDGENIFQLSETEQAGLYETQEMAGIIGKTYTLNIELAAEINGHKTYTSSDKMMTIGQIDSINLFYNDNWEVWEIQLYAQEPPTEDFYMFRWMKNNVMITDTIDEINVSDDSFFNGSYANGIGVGWLSDERDDEKPMPGDTITLIMSTTTEDYANFVWDVQDETGYNNPLFSGPPANIPSNISNGALGFFAAFPNRRSSMIF